MKALRPLLVITLCSVSCFALHAQILEGRSVNGKEVSCLHSGLFSDLEDCTARARWYAYAFIGRITAVTSVEKDEFELDLVPEEVFHGDPGTLLKVRTSQGLCLPALKIGDRWLFYLRSEPGKPIVLDYYGNDSKPVGKAVREIETLRTLQSIGARGLLRGSVQKGRRFVDSEPVPNARVVARDQADVEHVTVTDSDGEFQFEPLPAGLYKITVDPVGSFVADSTSQDLKAGECWGIRLTRTPHTRISGQVLYTDGSPVKDAAVILFDANNEGYNILHTDKDGRYSFDTITAGGYVIGANSPTAPAWKFGGAGGAGIELPPAEWFFPSAHDRAAAQVINLKRDDMREDIDFEIPGP